MSEPSKLARDTEEALFKTCDHRGKVSDCPCRPCALAILQAALDTHEQAVRQRIAKKLCTRCYQGDRLEPYEGFWRHRIMRPAPRHSELYLCQASAIWADEEASK